MATRSISKNVDSIPPMVKERNSGAAFFIHLDDATKETGDQTKSNTSSLQQAFENYRNAKLEGHRLIEKNKYLRKGYRSDPERMRKLRTKFVEQAKKYLGVPYAKKYFNPESAEYNSNLFLDCCGLVRRVMRDLQEDFGFRIGPGNQSYMFDTLPKVVENLNDVKPGDLIFISAIYFNPKMKKQPHNITHVEIMLGESEKTIGARWNNGKISIFDSFKFESKSYHSQKYLIKSIDPWLLGICRSYCLNHPWNFNTAIRNKRSIFYFAPSQSSKSSKSPKRRRRRRTKNSLSATKKLHRSSRRSYFSSSRKKTSSKSTESSKTTALNQICISNTSSEDNLADQNEFFDFEMQTKKISDLRIE